MTLTAWATTSCSSRATCRRSSAAVGAQTVLALADGPFDGLGATLGVDPPRPDAGRPGARSARGRRTAGPRPRWGWHPGRGSRSAIKQATMMTTNAERVRSPARSPAREAGQTDGETWIREHGECVRVRSAADDTITMIGSGQTRRTARGRTTRTIVGADLAGPSVIRGQQGDQGEHDDGAERIEPFEQQRGGLSVVGWQAILGVGHPVHCTSARREIHPSRGPGRLIRTVEIGACPVRSGEAVPARRPMTGRRPPRSRASNDPSSRRSRCSADPSQWRHQALRRLARNPLSTSSTWTSNRAGSPRSWVRPAAASRRCST